MPTNTSCSNKAIVGSLAFLFLGAAIAMWVMGYYVIMAYKSINTLTSPYYILAPTAIIIFVGVVFLLATITGCCATCCDGRTCFCYFFFFVFITIVILVTATILSHMYKNEVASVVERDISLAMDKYAYEQLDASANDTSKQIDLLQQYFKCCGTHNYTSWNNTSFGRKNLNHVPLSCCKLETNCFEGDLGPMKEKESDYIYKNGCIPEVQNFLIDNLKYLEVGGTILLVFLGLGLISAMFRCRCFCRCNKAG